MNIEDSHISHLTHVAAAIEEAQYGLGEGQMMTWGHYEDVLRLLNSAIEKLHAIKQM